MKPTKAWALLNRVGELGGDAYRVPIFRARSSARRVNIYGGGIVHVEIRKLAPKPKKAKEKPSHGILLVGGGGGGGYYGSEPPGRGGSGGGVREVKR